jgi:putative nucleotidyltransferase with HDIG domain
MSASAPRRRRWRWRPRLGLPSPAITRWALGILLVAVLTAIVLSYDLAPGRLTYAVGDVAEQMVIAPRTFRYLDTAATAALREEAAAQVLPRIRQDPDALGNAEAQLDERFNTLLQAKSGEQAARAAAARLLPGLSDRALAWALGVDAVALKSLHQRTRALLRSAMSHRISEGGLAQARAAAASQAAGLRLEPEATALVAEVVTRSMVPNEVLDPEATARARTEARWSVAPVEHVLPKGYTVLRRGQPVTQQELDMLDALGLRTGQLDVSRAIVALALAALGVLLVGVQIRAHFGDLYEDRRRLLLLALVVLASMAPLISTDVRSAFMSLLFITAGCMIIAALINPQVALTTAAVESVLVGVMGETRLALVVVTLGSSLAAIALVSDLWTTRNLFRASLLLAGANAVLVATVGRLVEGLADNLTMATLLSGAWGVISPPLAVGAIHVLQYPFDIATPARLLELSNPNNQPLLRELLTKAPGTYHASLMVASLAEAAAQVVGADPLLCRVAAYYHDVGKLRRPNFFVENQYPLGIGNIHERLSPSLSNLVVASHVKDGVELARRHRLPSLVCDVIAQHHGTTLTYFYRQAMSGPSGAQVSAEQYRYPGPKPQSKEAAILMLADSAQAAVQSLRQPTQAAMESIIKSVIRDRLDDGQLDECGLTFRDIARIRRCFIKVLGNLFFHSRIEYPPQPRTDRNHASAHTGPAAPADRPTAAPADRAPGR